MRSLSLRLFDKEYFFRFARMAPQRFKHFFTFGGKKFQWKQIVAELAGIFVECSFKFISRLKAYEKKMISDNDIKASDCVLRFT